MENDFTVLFNNFDLNSIPYVYFVRRYPNTEANISLTTFARTRRDGQVVTSARREPKNIALEGYIIAPSRVSYEEAMDTLKYRTSGIERPLIISQAGIARRYIATKQPNIIEEHIEAGKTRINISFLCSEPYGKDTFLTTDTFTATATPNGLAHTFLGTAEARPTFTITLDSLTGGTTKHVGIGNGSSGQQVQVTRTWTAGDVAIFNCETQMAYVNGAIVDYSGVFPVFEPQKENAYYYDSLTTRSATVELAYEKNYL